MEKLDNIIFESFKGGDLRPALKDTSGNIVSYSELGNEVNRYVTKFKSYLQESRNNTIAIVGEKTIVLPILLYSIICSENAYLPIDFRFPQERIKEIVYDAQPNAIIIQNKYLHLIETILAHIIFHTNKLNNDFTFVTLTFSAHPYPNDLIYILYTSGSTGTPKGVMHTHKSVLSFLSWCNRTITGLSKANFISISPLQFDLSVFDLFFPLMQYGTLVMLTEEEISNPRLVAKAVADNHINCLYATPSFLQLLSNTGKLQDYNFEKVSHILLAGEQLYWELLHKLKKDFLESVFYNFYGPTETNVCFYYKADWPDEKRCPDIVPIGKPCGAGAYYLNEDEGTSELWVATDTLMHGYVRESSSVFKIIDDTRYYNTADTVRAAFDGNFVFTGRTDRMIKKNGFRIEPSEIEKQIKTLQGVSNAIALLIPANSGSKLVIFILSELAYSLLEIKQYCLKKLPYYMVPDDVVFVEELPLNFNHKTDAQKLIDKYAG